MNQKKPVDRKTSGTRSASGKTNENISTKKQKAKRPRMPSAALGKGAAPSKLGRGLSALFSASKLNPDEDLPGTVSAQTNVLRRLPVSSIRAHPGQPRRHFDEVALKELTASIRQVGIIQPIIVREVVREVGSAAQATREPSGDAIRYELIAGERRLRATKHAGLTEIPAFIERSGDEAIFEKMLIENIQREDLSPLEEAHAYHTLMKTKGWRQEQVAESVGKSRSHVANLLRLLKLPSAIQQLLATGQLTFGAARALIGLSEKQLAPLLSNLQKRHLSVREIEQYVASLVKTSDGLGQGKKSAKKQGPTSMLQTHESRLLQEIEAKLREKLGTKVRLFPLKRNTGKLEIEYYSYDHLEELSQKMQ